MFCYTAPQWFGKIDFGTPPQSLVMLIDSGSADTVVFDDQCQTCQLNNHTAFNEEASSTFVNTGATFSTQYGDGTTLSGILGKDTVALSKRLAVSSQLIALISSRQGGSSAHAWDGILGIGPDQLSYVDGNVTPLSNAIKNSQLRAPLVGIVLRKASSLPWGGSDGLYNSGEYRWGAINAAYLASPIIYTPVTSTYYWGVDMAQIWVNGQAMTNANSARRALIDTGTTLVYTSDYSAAAIHAQIPGSTLNAQQGAYYVPCSPAYNAPNVFFEVAGHRWGVPPADIAFRPSGLNDGMCVSGIQGGAEDFTILGDVFIKNHCELGGGLGAFYNVWAADRSLRERREPSARLRFVAHKLMPDIDVPSLPSHTLSSLPVLMACRRCRSRTQLRRRQQLLPQGRTGQQDRHTGDAVGWSR